MDLTNKEPSSPSGYLGLAACCVQRKDLTTARKLYATALEIAPRSANALVGLGTTYSLESDYTNAAAKYESALAVDEGSPEAHWGLAIAYAELGRWTEARSHLNRFKELAPGSRHIDALEKFVGQPDASPNAAPPHR